MVANLSLVEYGAVVEDPREDRTKAHDLQDILVLSFLAVLCGAEGWEDIELFAKIRFAWLKKFIKLRNGVPSHDTISRVFRMIRPDAFQEAFLAWVSGLNFEDDRLNLVAIDGKSLRQSYDKKSFKSMLYIVAAWRVQNRVVLGCQFVDQKSHEITAISDAKHGRQESRYYYQAPIPESMKELTDSWKGAKSIGQVHNITLRDGKECCEIRYYLSSLPVGVKKFAGAVRSHWGIENSLQWVLEMTFNEDQNRIRKENRPDNFALLRRFAINILS